MVVVNVSYPACVCIVRFFFQAEDGIRDLVRSRGLGDVYKRQTQTGAASDFAYGVDGAGSGLSTGGDDVVPEPATMTLLATGLAGMAAARRRKAAKA